MRYRFVGSQDVPEWILAEVSVLSKISCVRLKLISRQVVLDLCGSSPLDFEKLARLVPKDSGFTGSDVKATVAAITFILTNATRYAVSHEVLNAELQQLGLPKENSDGISRPFRIHRDKLLAQAASDALCLPRLCSVSSRSDFLVSSSVHGSLMPAPSRVVHLSLGVADRSGAGLSAGKRVPAADASDSSSATALLASHAAEKELAALSAQGSNAAVGAAGQLGRLKSTRIEDERMGTALVEAQAAVALRAINAGPLLAPAADSASASASSSAIKVRHDRFFNLSMTAETAQSLLKELKTARKVLGALEASTAAAAASSS